MAIAGGKPGKENPKFRDKCSYMEVKLGERT